MNGIYIFQGKKYRKTFIPYNPDIGMCVNCELHMETNYCRPGCDTSNEYCYVWNLVKDESKEYFRRDICKTEKHSKSQEKPLKAYSAQSLVLKLETFYSN